MVHPAMRGEITALAPRVLLEAAEPVATEEMTRRIMVARGLISADKTLFKRVKSTIY